jgi:hypothetical protein
MNITRIILGSLGGFVAYFVFGGLSFVAIPSMKTEFQKYPAVYRSHEGQMSHFPAGMAGMLLSIIVMAVLYAMLYTGGSGLMEGARFGALIGLFVVGSSVLHNYANLNIGVKITVISAIAYLLEWTVTGIAIGLIYRPLPPR